MQRRTSAGGGGGRGPWNWASRDLTSMAFATTAVLLLVAGAASAGGSSSKTLTAPFTTAHVKRADTTLTLGCENYTFVRKASFNTTTGRGGFEANDSAHWCNANTNNTAEVRANFTVTFPIHVGTSGNRSIAVAWETIANLTANLSLGRCISRTVTGTVTCERVAAASLVGALSLEDLTTGTLTSASWTGFRAHVDSMTSCSNTRCSTTGTKATSVNVSTGVSNATWFLNGTMLNSTHHYLLRLTISGEVYVQLSISGIASILGATADARVDLAGPAYREVLRSVTIS